MADKSTQLVLSALSHAAAAGTGVPLHGARGSAGLFPPTPLGRQAAQRCQEEGWLCPVEEGPALTSEPTRRGERRATTLLFRLTEKGLAHLLTQASPRQVLEDFVRVLEARQVEVGELLTLARRMQIGVEALKAHAEKVLHSLEGNPPNGFPGSPGALNTLFQQFHHGSDAGPCVTARPLADRVLARLAGWQGSGAAEDCPLPDLYRQMGGEPGLTIGRFHDAVRALHEAGQVYLHPWTGPLYDVPEPSYALLVGHEVLYYASVRKERMKDEG